MATIRVQTADFDVGAELARLTASRTDIGGIGAFVGTVRGGDVTELMLEHYPGMTERALAQIVAKAEARWPLCGCTVIHRVGALKPGENIVLVLAASAHRQAALEAAAFLIDWLKTDAPFWKKETRTDGSTGWVEARESDEATAATWLAER